MSEEQTPEPVMNQYGVPVDEPLTLDQVQKMIRERERALIEAGEPVQPAKPPKVSRKQRVVYPVAE